ncbi:type VI secretion system lipoprotein TssJ [Neisseria sp. Ec49-e6-T10]|uniref:type VI secretion system lipoprotein TssJ n=1 Tax=Neisseria sp. Ec49-e6-T10 TaxID=3140744 RepID=UPI003EBEF169
MFGFLKKMLIFVVVFSVVGCAAKKQPPKESDESGDKVRLSFVVDQIVNTDIDGRTSPIRVDFFQLTSNEEFIQADFSELLNPKNILEDKLLQHDQVMLHPDEFLEADLKFDSKTQHVGIIAHYRDIDSKIWKLSFTANERPWYQLTYKRYLYLKLDEMGLSRLSSAEYKQVKKMKKKEQKEARQKQKEQGKKKPPSAAKQGFFTE